jgi:hypothetical protein
MGVDDGDEKESRLMEARRSRLMSLSSSAGMSTEVARVGDEEMINR